MVLGVLIVQQIWQQFCRLGWQPYCHHTAVAAVQCTYCPILMKLQEQLCWLWLYLDLALTAVSICNLLNIALDR